MTNPPLSVTTRGMPWTPPRAHALSLRVRRAGPRRTHRRTEAPRSGPGSRADRRLGLVDHDHEPIGSSRDALLARLSRTTPLDQAESGVDLVGAVDGDRELRHVVQRRERDPESPGPHGRLVRGRNAHAGEAVPHSFGEPLHREAHGRPRASRNRHSVLDQFGRRTPGGPLWRLVSHHPEVGRVRG